MKISQRVSELLRDYFFPYSGFSKGHNSVKTVGRIMVLGLCILSNLALYSFHENI